MSGRSEDNVNFRSEKLDEPTIAGDSTTSETLRSDVFENLSDLNRQVRMISESLAACKKISRRRQLISHHPRNLYGSPDPQSSARISLPPPKEPNEVFASGNDLPIVVSEVAREESFSPDPFKPVLEPGFVDDHSRDPEVPPSLIQEKEMVGVGESDSSGARWWKADEINSIDLLAEIQRELTHLMEIVPSASLQILQVSDILLHYKECFKCFKKSYGLFPLILTRLKKLIKHVIQKRRRKYVWPKDSRYSVDSRAKKTDIRKPVVTSETIEIGRSKKVDASTVADGKPGVQVQLHVKPEKVKKRFYDSLKKLKIDYKSSSKEVNGISHVFHLHEISHSLRMNVLSACTPPDLIWHTKRQIIQKRAFFRALAFLSLAAKPETYETEILLPRENLFILETVRVESYLKKISRCEERIIVPNHSNLVNIEVSEGRSSCSDHNERDPNTDPDPPELENSGENVSDLVRELLREAEEEDMMQILKVKDFEDEVKSLKDLMMEVHKNQIELSRVLLEKGIYSQPIIKLTDPKMLEEETEAVKKAAFSEPPWRDSSPEQLQVTVDELKKKCTIKNRMIVALVQGLRSDVPKEWWEQLVDCIFNESKPIEEFDTERVNEFIRQTSLYLIEREKASTEKLATAPIKDAITQGTFSREEAFLGSVQTAAEVDSKEGPDGFAEAICKKRQELVKQRERLSNVPEPRYASSFIQDILYEDSQAGIAVVDLFVAVKRAKDKLNHLTKINNETWTRMNALNKQVGTMKTDYRKFVENVSDFFDEMTDAANAWVMKSRIVPSLCESPNSRDRKNHQEKYLEEVNLDALEKLKTDERQSFHAEEEKPSSPCFLCRKDAEKIPENKKSTVGLVNKSPEDAMAALIVSSLKSKNYVCQRDETDKTTLDVCQSQNDQENGSDLDVQVICDVCEILNVVSVGNCSDEERAREGKEDLAEKAARTTANGNEGGDDDDSEEDFAFEEAMTDPHEVKERPSVTCMGDLTKTGRKKNVSTLTTDSSGPEISWISKLTEEIKSKLKNLRPKEDAEESTKIEETDKSPKISEGGGLEFTISANTPVGVFDVTIRQYKQFNQRGANGQRLESENLILERKKAEMEEFMTAGSFVGDSEQFWSEDSFQITDSDRFSQVSAEEDMEEFLEVHVQSQKEAKIEKKSSISLKKGTMVKTTLKQGRTPMFEIEKYQPKYFVQEILTKKRKPEGEIEEGGSLAGLGKPSDDLVIYIQVEIDEEEDESNSKKIFIECKSTTSTDDVPMLLENGKKEFKVLKSAVHRNEEKKCRTSGRNHTESAGSSGGGIASEREPKKKSVTFLDEAEVAEEREMGVTGATEDEGGENQVSVRLLQEKAGALVCHMPLQVHAVERWEVREPVRRPAPDLLAAVERCDSDLRAAIDLIRRVENDVVGVKLSDAISILPALESELRKHLQNKMKEISPSEEEPSTETSMQDFFSAVDFWPNEEETESRETENSEERLINLYFLLSNLEDAVKANEESSENIDLCDESSSSVYRLLQALTQSIKDLENGANMTNLAQTLNITSQLDAAVREYDSLVRKPLAECRRKKENFERVSTRERMKEARKKVFQAVEEEAVRTEGRIEKDFDRIDRLERENDEAWNFVEAFLEKTARRSNELNLLKEELKILSCSLEKLYSDAANRIEQSKKEKEKSESEESERIIIEEPLRNTFSGLLIALNELKIKAKEKREACRELLESGLFEGSPKVAPAENVSRSSRCSFTTATRATGAAGAAGASGPTDDLRVKLKDFRRIGQNSLYLAWSKPEGRTSDFVTGYEVFVNEKLNQKVRNPQRTQAVLYSVDLTKKVEIQLYGLVENGPKMLLAAVTHYDAAHNKPF